MVSSGRERMIRRLKFKSYAVVLVHVPYAIKAERLVCG